MHCSLIASGKKHQPRRTDNVQHAQDRSAFRHDRPRRPQRDAGHSAGRGLYLNFGGRHDSAGVGVYLGDADRVHYRRDRYQGHHRVCTPGRALDKAERIGLRHARVVDVDRRTIEVRGHKRGHRVNVTFGRSPNCPIVGW